MPYTEQQQKAITTRDVSVALAAGAGCGKTFVLTQRFVSELLRDPTEETLAGLTAITFTDRAAREMKDRIREAIREQLKQCELSEVHQWQAILRDLESARIQTIHSFCTSTLRSFATELGLDPDFAVLDEPTATALLAETIQEVLERLLVEQHPAACQFVLRFGIEGAISRMRSLAGQRFQWRETAAVADTPEELASCWRDLHQHSFLPEQLKKLAELPAGHRLFELMQAEESTSKKMQERRPLLLMHLEKLHRTQALEKEELQELRANATVQYVNKKHWSDEEIHEDVKVCCATLRDELDHLLPLFELDEGALAVASEFGMQALQLTEEVNAAYLDKKKTRAVVDFDDLLLLMRDLVTEHSQARKQLQQTIDFLMLDEFQDTDPVQTEIVKSLCGDRLTSGGLFLVGDVKQSIYRFRRADPEVFRQLRGQIPPEGQLALTLNFRSQQEVLDFVNFLFAPEMPDEYDHLEAFDHGPYLPKKKVEFLWATAPGLPDMDATQKRTLEAEWIAARLSELLQDETPRVRTKDPETNESILRAAEPGDIVILLRAFSNLGVYEDALRQAGLDYYVVGGRAFFAQQEIYDLVNLCRFLDDDTDEVSLAGVLRSPLFAWSDDSLMTMTRQAGSLAAGIRQPLKFEEFSTQQQHPVQSAIEVLNTLLNLRLTATIGELLRYAIRETAYDAALLTEFLGERKVANLQKLIDMADDFDRTGLLGLTEFAERLLESVEEESREELAATHPETGNVIRLMTVHQSKGLEFPIVVTADVNRRSRSSSDSIVLNPRWGPLVTLPMIKGETAINPAMKMFREEEKRDDEAEAVRLLYVAVTRAADYLILSAPWDPDEAVVGAWLRLLQQRFDLLTGLPTGDSLLGQTGNSGTKRDRIPVITVTAKKPKRSQTERQTTPLKLGEWPELLAKTEPVPPHSSVLPVPRDGSRQVRFSVSQLEAKVEELQQREQAVQIGNKGEGSLGLLDSERLGHLLHAAVEHLNPADPLEPAELIAQMTSLSADYLSPELHQMAVARLGKFMHSDLLQELKDAQHLHRESEFLLRWDKDATSPPALIVGTVDCLLQDNAGQWHLIDYKTGYLPSSSAEIVEKFGVQMLLYAKAIQGLTGSFPASIRIVQLGESIRTEVVQIDEENQLRIERQIDEAIQFLRSVGN